MTEYFIKDGADADARGPFNLEQMTSLAENGHVTLSTLVYDEENDIWQPLDSNAELKSVVFPERRRLKVRPKENIDSINRRETEGEVIDVKDILLAAEGKTGETRKHVRGIELREKGAYYGITVVGVLLITFALVLLLPQFSTLVGMNMGDYIANPFIILGLIGFFVALVVFLQVPQMYPFIRFYSCFSFGFLLLYFYSSGQLSLALFSSLITVCLYLVTLFAHLYIVMGLGLLGMAGILLLAIQLLS